MIFDRFTHFHQRFRLTLGQFLLQNAFEMQRSEHLAGRLGLYPAARIGDGIPRNQMKFLQLIIVLALFPGAALQAQSPYQTSTDFVKYAMKLRENALLKIEPQVFIPTTSRTLGEGRYPWKKSIVTTCFWVGEAAAVNNPVHNRSSSWDVNWTSSFGGFDNPDRKARRGFIPAAFIPKQNPFYYALPYNDVTRGSTKTEARRVIPWFREEFERNGKSVCQDRWIAVRKGNRIAYAQWSDCGPFRTDHWQYVFGNERPKPNLNQGAGLDVSPAVRDYLGISGKDVTDWKFVDFKDVPPGPWSRYGNNNDFVINARKSAEVVVKNQTNPTSTVPDAPRVITQ